MPDPANEPLPIPNSEQEYLNGVADDGGALNIISEHLIPPREQGETHPPIGPHALNAESTGGPNSRFHLEADKKVLDAEREHVQRVRECVELLQDTVRLGKPARELLAQQAEGALLDQEIANETKRRHLERLKTAPIDQLVEGEVASGIAVPAMSDGRVSRPSAREARGEVEPEAPDTHCRDGNATPTPGQTDSESAPKTPREPRPPREPRVRAPRFSPALMLALALRAAKDLPKLSAELRDLEAKLLPAEAELKLKQEFYLDKAVSIITDTLNSMDEKFGKLGFGNWMPFRFLDQWLMFSGVLNRVLAAHGLVPAGNPEIYRKLLDTPSIFPRTNDCGPPKSWGLAYRAREFRFFQQMVDRIADVRAGRGPPL